MKHYLKQPDKANPSMLPKQYQVVMNRDPNGVLPQVAERIRDLAQAQSKQPGRGSAEVWTDTWLDFYRACVELVGGQDHGLRIGTIEDRNNVGLEVFGSLPKDLRRSMRRVYAESPRVPWRPVGLS